MKRLKRFLLAVLALMALLAAAACGGFAWLVAGIDGDAVRERLERIAAESLNAEISFDGEIIVTRWPELRVALPHLTLARIGTGDRIAEIDSSVLDIALLPLALGALQVESASFSGLKTSLDVPALSGDALFSGTFAGVNFPEYVRVGAVAVSNSELTVTVDAESDRHIYRLGGASLSLSSLSPELAADFEAAADVSETIRPVLVPAPAAGGGENQEAEGAGAGSPAEGAVADAARAVEAASRAVGEFLRPAADAVRQAAEGAEVILSRQGLKGQMSAAGRLSFSSAKRFITLQDVRSAAELQDADGATVNASVSAASVRVRGQELSGVGLSAVITRPETRDGEIHLGADDFRIREAKFMSPSMQFSFTRQTADRTATFNIETALESDLRTRRSRMEDFNLRLSAAGGTADSRVVTANLRGTLYVEEEKESARAQLSGTFAGAPLTFEGTVSGFARPRAEGTVTIGDLDLANIPLPGEATWLNRFSFEGDVRVGGLKHRRFAGSQGSARARFSHGDLALTDAVINFAGGRIKGSLDVSRSGGWTLAGRLDSVSLEKLVEALGGRPSASGTAYGSFSVSGEGFPSAVLEGTGDLRIMNGSYRGIDFPAVRARVLGSAGGGKELRADAATAFDEASGEIVLADGRLAVRNFRARSQSLRASGWFDCTPEGDDLKGHVLLTYPPAKGLPAVRVSAELSGTAASPAWDFDWREAGRAFMRAIGKPVPGEDIEEDGGEEEKSIWQSVRDFFRF